VECGVPVIPITIVGTHYTMPKARFAIKPGLVTIIFHPPIEPKDFGSRDCLMEKVRAAIDSGLPEELRQPAPVPNESREQQGGPAYA
jgi:1-acyl-sn-glycerol-3-phosphate acyltransferase